MQDDNKNNNLEGNDPKHSTDSLTPEAHPHIDLIKTDQNTNIGTASSDSKLEPVKKPSRRWGVIVTLVLVVILVVIAGFIAFIYPTINKKSEPQNSIESSFKSLESSYQDKSIKFIYPANNFGWILEESSNPNVKSYKYNNSSCKAIFQTSDKVPEIITNGGNLNSAIDSYFKGIGNALKNNDLKTGSIGTHPFNTNTEGQINFITKQATYTGNDGVLYKAEVAGQWLGNYQFIVLTVCSQNDWSPSINAINSFLNNITLEFSKKQ